MLSGSSVVTQPEEVRRKIGFLTSELKLEDFFTPDYLYDFFSLDCTVFRQTDGTPENACCLHGSAFRSLPRCALGIVHGNEAEGIPGDLTGAGSGDHNFR